MELEETEEGKKYVQKLSHEEKTILQGDDVIHLTYLSALINQQKLETEITFYNKTYE